MRAKHTPGPWQATGIDGPLTLGGDVIDIEAVTEDGYVRTGIGTVWVDTEEDGSAEMAEGLANARLIAAAPELLSALAALILATPMDGPIGVDLARALARADAAITSAIGEPS